MECKKCGKMIDMRKELKFCSGCGAEIIEEKPAPKLITRERAGARNPIITERAVELDTRTRVFYLCSIVGFFVALIMVQFSIASVLTAFLLAVPGGALIGIFCVIAVSKTGPALKNQINESFWFIPVKGPGRGFVEGLASALPLMGKLPQDAAKPADKSRKK
ncbi:MAG: hypothetical protein WCX65_03290 [bacterium]